LRVTIDVGLRLAADEATYQKTRTVAPWLAVAVVFAAAVLLRQAMPFNVDVSWWLIVSERMLDGQRLYVDILETNPPMAVSVYLLGVALARAIHVRPEVMTNGLIFLLIAASLAMTWRILQYSSLLGRAAGGALAVWATVLLCILPMYDFGQREHLALVTMLPALGVYILRGNREPVLLASVLIGGLSAAITMNFKPYFAFAVGFCIFAAAAQARDWRVVFALENWIAAGLVVVYSVCIFAFYPEYFTIIYPLVRDVYLLLKSSMLALFVTAATALWIGAVRSSLPCKTSNPNAMPRLWWCWPPPSVSRSLSSCSARDGVIMPIPWLRWVYWRLVVPLRRSTRSGRDQFGFAPPRRWSLRPCSRRRACGSMQASTSGQSKIRLHGWGPHPKILMLSAAAVIGHPMVRTLQGTWVSRQEAFWVREIVRRSQLDQSIDSETAARLQVYIARERAGLIEDFRKQPRMSS
jgi:hypothetical protein